MSEEPGRREGSFPARSGRGGARLLFEALGISALFALHTLLETAFTMSPPR
jgi:hypothetical protein